MIRYLIINMKLKEEKEDIVSYYFECDEFVKDYDLAGIIEFNKSILSDFDLNGDKLMYAADHYINGDIRVLRNATNSAIDEDGYDWIALFAMEAILTSAKERDSYLEDMTIVSHEMQEKLMQDEVLVEHLKQ